MIGDDEGLRRKIGPGPFTEGHGGGFAWIRLIRESDGQVPRLLLKVEFAVSLDEEAEHLTVVTSTFGLWVRPDPKRAPRPLFRLEYDRETHGKPPAHVHLHAESAELGWIYGTAGVPLPRMAEIHSPDR